MTDHIIDANGRRLGRIATEVALILQGKHSALYDPRLPGDDKVVVKNAKQITMSGNKEDTKIYYSHTTQFGHLKKRSYRNVFLRDPAWVIRHAVYLMLPKNRLRKDRMKRLTIEI